jgi:predicted helicase
LVHDLNLTAWLTLEGIPTTAHHCRLGNRSVLDWIVDQYQVERSKENPDEILSDPNRLGPNP